MSDQKEIVPAPEGTIITESQTSSSNASTNNRSLSTEDSSSSPRNPKSPPSAAKTRQSPAPVPATVPPSQVTFEGDTTASAETLSTTASTASLAAAHRSPPSPAPSQASSEVSVGVEETFCGDVETASLPHTMPIVGIRHDSGIISHFRLISLHNLFDRRIALPKWGT